MSHIFNTLFEQYSTYETYQVVLEITAVLFGLLSVWYSKQNKILVYPTGMLSTAIFVFLLWQWGLLGDMMINGYYFGMSVYGWYLWTKKQDGVALTKIGYTTRQQHQWSVVLFIATIILVLGVYSWFNKLTSWTAYVDAVTTAVFFVGMWLMAKRKIENWIYWIIGDIISVPLYLYKGLLFTSLQYLIFTIIAFYGYRAWKNNLNNTLQH